MTNRFLFALIVLSSFVEATFPAGAIPVPFAILAIQSTDASGAFILVRKGKGMVTGRNALSGTVAMKSMGSPAIADISWHARVQRKSGGWETIQGPEAATKTSSMAKTDLWCRCSWDLRCAHVCV
jgi:hypothetical protein